MKKSSLRRTSSPRTRGKPIQRTPVKKRNVARRKSEFARAYGSKERVAWVRSQPCAWCGTIGFSVNAHTENGGRGRKADAATIAPLCASRGSLLGCHEAYDGHLGELAESLARSMIQSAARETAIRWQSHVRGSTALEQRVANDSFTGRAAAPHAQGLSADRAAKANGAAPAGGAA